MAGPSFIDLESSEAVLFDYPNLFDGRTNILLIINNR